MTAEGMRKSELFWPHHGISTAAKQPGKRWSAPRKLLEVPGQRETETSAQRGRGRGAGARRRPRDIPVGSRWRKDGGEERGRERLVGDERRRLRGAQGTKRSEAAARTGREEAGTHTATGGTW